MLLRTKYISHTKYKKASSIQVKKNRKNNATESTYFVCKVCHCNMFKRNGGEFLLTHRNIL